MDDNKTNISDSEIRAKASAFKSLLGDKKFDEDKFRTDTENMKNSEGSLNHLDAETYRKKDDDNNYGNSDGQFFKSSFKNGIHTAVGLNGKIIQSKDFADLNRQLAAEFVANAKETGKDPQTKFTCPNKNPKDMEIFAREFVKAGVIVSGDVPNDPKFWNSLKQDYLKNPEHNLEQWNKLTSKVPGDYMEQGKEKTAKTASKGRFISNLRKGINTNLTPIISKPTRQTTLDQSNAQQFLNKKLMGMG